MDGQGCVDQSTNNVRANQADDFIVLAPGEDVLESHVPGRALAQEEVFVLTTLLGYTINPILHIWTNKAAGLSVHSLGAEAGRDEVDIRIRGDLVANGLPRPF